MLLSFRFSVPAFTATLPVLLKATPLLETVNVVLVGYRGTGKSSVAERVAAQLGLRAVSLDAELVRKAGKPIPEVVAERGWPGFRDLEEEIVRTFAAQDGLVIDCGGRRFSLAVEGTYQ